jgi:hypothetical protein
MITTSEAEMLNTRDLYIHFVGRMTAWGLGLGAALGFAFVPIYLLLLVLINLSSLTVSDVFTMIVLSLTYGMLGALIGAIVGTAMGLVLGLILALVTRIVFSTLHNQYVVLSTITAAAIGFSSAIFAFTLAGEILVVISAPYFIIAPAIIAAGAAAFATRRVASLYVEANREVA